ncbi:hypothetical protein SAMN04488074_119117 [Lentzea albidocapillata subsp. violacea]|uniref:Uncharacterized protein n=1 Tax=Lentzea albidocapillata subsp. violacea TaxID=128104 RepID=A0A1G9S431_9PSEU|nr:hypothetical protein [Lentzea albidocapillata]SDM30263.1 hypothetical protein SAMN04488074_119117 [Lentzea albidocapillata subsp. violacea]
MNVIGAKLALYLPVLAAWIAFVGAVLNRAAMVVVVPLGAASALGVTALITGTSWLIVAVVALWLWGVAWMVRGARA